MDFILEQDRKLVAFEVKTGSVVTNSDASGLRAFRDCLKKSQSLVRGVVLHGGQGQGRPLDTDILALPGVGWWGLEVGMMKVE